MMTFGPRAYRLNERVDVRRDVSARRKIKRECESARPFFFASTQKEIDSPLMSLVEKNAVFPLEGASTLIDLRL